MRYRTFTHKILIISIFIISVFMFTACQQKDDSISIPLKELNQRYDTHFSATQKFSLSENSKGERIVEGVAISEEGYRVEFVYNLDTNTLEDNYEEAKFNKETADTIKTQLNLDENKTVINTYLNAKSNHLEVLIAVPEDTTYNQEQLRVLADSFLSPKAVITVYTLSNTTFSTLQQDFKETGKLTHDSIKGYLIINKEVFETSFDISECSQPEKENSKRCIEYRESMMSTP